MSPLLIVFETVCEDDLEFSDDLESYPELLESDWYMFWKNKGEDIVNASWFKLYSEYVVKEEEENQEVTDINALKGSTQDCMQDKEITDNKENCVLNITGNSEVTDVNALKDSVEEHNQENTDNTNKSGEGNCVLKIPGNREVAGNSSSSNENDENCAQTILGNQEVISSNSPKEYDEKNGIQTFSEKQVAADIYTTNEGKEENCAQEILGANIWQNLWDEHYLTKYQDTYKLYQFVHYQQYCFHRPALIENCEESPVEEVEYEVESINQTEELKALGLPTSFGGRSNKHHRNIASDKDSESLSEEEFEMSPKCKEETGTKRAPKKKKEHKKKIIPKMILENKSLLKYWYKRFSLFSRFDEGIQLDIESWFSVTPEKVAVHMAERLACDTIIDGFCGSGGNAIQFASKCSRVIAIDIDPEKIKNARHNASIYGVAHKIDFIVGDYLQLCSSLKGDVVFLSPPWGGPEYISAKVYDIEESLVPVGASALVEKSRQISENIVFFLPKNSNREQIKKLAGVGNRVEIEHNYLNTRLVGLTAVYGDWLIDKKNLCQ